MGSWMALATQGCPKPIVWWWVVLHGTTRCQNSLGMFGPNQWETKDPSIFSLQCRQVSKQFHKKIQTGFQIMESRVGICFNHFVHQPFGNNPGTESFGIQIPSICCFSDQCFHWKTFLGAVEFHPSLPIHKIIKHFVHRFCITSRCVTKDLEVQKHTP